MSELVRLRGFVERLEAEGLLHRILQPVSTDYECAYWLKVFDGSKGVLFEKPKGYEIPIVGNVITNRSVLYKLLNATGDEQAFSKLLRAVNNPLPLKIEGAPGGFKRFSGIERLPVLRSYEGEAGPYITSAIIIAREPGGEVLNASIHRMLVIDGRHLAVRVVPRHLYYILEKARKAGVNFPVAVVIGSPPEVYVAAASSPPYGVFELEVANAMMEGKLRAFETENGIPVPLESEIIIIGELRTDVSAPEGPFVDVLGTLDAVRVQPVLEVKEVLVREDALYYAILQGGREHALLMGFYREALIWDSVRKVVPRVKAVRLLEAGGGWLMAAVSISKSADGDAKNALLAAFAAHPSLKIAIVVDEDVNVDDPNELLWAITTRMQPAEDLIVLQGFRGSSLDPTADPEDLTTSKLGIDATIPLTRDKKAFLRARIPYPS
ncbi:MAG: UbiD family decarboxylase [Thermofilaceae archaeon]